MAYASTSDFPLHIAVFNDDKTAFHNILENNSSDSKHTVETEINRKDKHGNTALHLAAMLGRHEYVEKLLDHGAQVTYVKNVQRWTPLAEACSYGNRETISIMAKKIRFELKKGLEKRTKGLDAALENICDFRLRLRWSFSSWVPFLSRYLPSDVCKITKKGCSIRVDTTLVDFTERCWERGDISFMYCNQNNPWVLMDNKAKVYQQIKYEHVDYNIDDQVDSLMSSDIVDAHLDTKNINFSRATLGWLWKEYHSAYVGPWHADFYQVDGLTFVVRKRREHLSEQDLKNNKKALACLTKSTVEESKNHQFYEQETDTKVNGSTSLVHAQNDDDDDEVSVDDEEEVVRRESLPPPPKRNVTWDEYISAPEGYNPVLGREPIIKENSKVFKAKIALSQKFPLTKSALLDILLAVAPLKLFKKLRDFVELKMPDGFPVSMQIPVFPAVIANVTFEDFTLDDGSISDTLFRIPDEYEETNERFNESMS